MPDEEDLAAWRQRAVSAEQKLEALRKLMGYAPDRYYELPAGEGAWLCEIRKVLEGEDDDI